MPRAWRWRRPKSLGVICIAASVNRSHFPRYESLIDTVGEQSAAWRKKRDERVFCLAPKFLRLPFHPASIILSLQLICSSKSHINTPPPQCEADADGMLFHLFRSVPFNMRESSDGVNYSVSEQDKHLIRSLFRCRLGFGVQDRLDLWPTPRHSVRRRRRCRGRRGC